MRSSRLSWLRCSCFLEFGGVFAKKFLQLLCNAFATEWECRPGMSWGFCCYCWWPLVRSLCLSVSLSRSRLVTQLSSFCALWCFVSGYGVIEFLCGGEVIPAFSSLALHDDLGESKACSFLKLESLSGWQPIRLVVCLFVCLCFFFLPLVDDGCHAIDDELFKNPICLQRALVTYLLSMCCCWCVRSGFGLCIHCSAVFCARFGFVCDTDKLCVYVYVCVLFWC